MNVTRRRQAVLGLVVIPWLLSGCGPRPNVADPGAARQALQTTLEAWKGGTPQEAFAKQSSTYTSDARWADGYKLLGYDIAAGEEYSGHDLNFQVTLRLEDAKGKKLQEKVTYRVATSPRRVVFRAVDM